MTERKPGGEKEKLSFEQKDLDKGYTLLSLIGELDMWSLPQAKERVGEMIAQNKVKLVLDLEKMNYIDSSGLGFFIGTLKKLKDAGGELMLINLNAYIYHIFKLIQLQHIIQTYESLDEAQKHF